jgi:peroxiredoxin
VDEPALGYNTPHFSLKITSTATLADSLPVRVGQPAPDFEAVRLDGEAFRLSDARDTRHVVLMTGSITSPLTALHAPALNELQEQYGNRGVDFYLVYTRESHPGEHYPHHTTFEQKLAHARDLRRLEDVRVPILVDSLDGAMHRAYGQWSTALFLVHRDGRLVYRTTIAAPDELRLFLERFLPTAHLGSDPERSPFVRYAEWLLDQEPGDGPHYRVYERAGPKAFEDIWRVYPALRDRWPRKPE